MADEVNKQEAIIEKLMTEAEECINLGDFKSASDKCSEALLIKRNNPKAYLFALMAQYECKTIEDFKDLSEDYINSYNFKDLFKYGDVEWYALKSQLRIYAEESLVKYYERIYNESIVNLENAKTVNELKETIKDLKKIKDYKDSVSYVDACNEKIDEINKKNKKHTKNVKRLKKLVKCGVAGVVLGTAVSLIIIAI